MADRDELLRELRLAPMWHLRARAGLGAPEIASPPPSPALPAEPARSTMSRMTTTALAPATAQPDTAARIVRIAALDWSAFAADVDACTACKLCRTRNRSVPGVGSERADWLFVGEAPGADEDAKGEPFVGQAGRLLDNMLAAIDLGRGNNVYIANVLKCRPPGNRNPEPDEVAKCSPHLLRQIGLLRPKLILAMGRFAAQTLLDTDASIASLRGRVHRYAGVPLIVTYHPAYLLRNLPDKAKSWADLRFAVRTMAGL